MATERNELEKQESIYTRVLLTSLPPSGVNSPTGMNSQSVVNLPPITDCRSSAEQTICYMAINNNQERDIEFEIISP